MMYEQMHLFDFIDKAKEPEPGEWVDGHGPVIPHIMRRGFIGKKIVMDYSTQSHKWYKVGILEKVLTDKYWSSDGKWVECDRSIVYDGQKQRCSILHMPGSEIFELGGSHEKIYS